MKTTIFLTTLYLVFGFFACTKGNDNPQDVVNWTNKTEALYIHNAQKVAISEGFAGTVILTDGNCMPGGSEQSTCRLYPVSRRIRIYEATSPADVVAGPDHGTFKQVRSRLIATIPTDTEGFFQYSIKPGTYSLFIEEKGMLYASDADNAIISAVVVRPGKVSTENPVIRYAVY